MKKYSAPELAYSAFVKEALLDASGKPAVQKLKEPMIGADY